MIHIICTQLPHNKPGPIITELAARLKKTGKIYLTQDWVSALNYNSVEEAQAIWLNWDVIKTHYTRFHNEISKRHPQLPILLFHEEKLIPEIICKKNGLLFSVLNKSLIMENYSTLLKRLEIYNKIIPDFPKKGKFSLRPEGFGSFIGNSIEMLNLYKILYKVALTNFSVLITGESGTGKEIVANSIHLAGKRKEENFVAINCAAIPENLLESELFGFEKGAFTDAKQARPGKFEMAHKGTIFLDEIGDMPLALQTKLLRVLEDGVIQRLGTKTEKKVDIRLLAATNQNLQDLIEQKKFRSDLYYRLNVIPVELPALKDREDDFIILVLHLLGSILKKNPGTSLNLKWESINQLKTLNIPGNVRELENLLIRLVFQSDFPKNDKKSNPLSRAKIKNTQGIIPKTKVSDGDEILPLREVEMQAIQNALKKHQGNMSRAAASLKISRGTLYRKVKTYELEE